MVTFLVLVTFVNIFSFSTLMIIKCLFVQVFLAFVFIYLFIFLCFSVIVMFGL